MSVDGVGRIRNQPATRTTKSGTASGNSGFARMLEDGSEQTGATGGAGPVTALDSLLAVQASGTATDGKRRARQRANQLLNELDILRDGLLEGDVPPHRLEAIANLARSQRADVDDPELAGVLDEIDLRVQVELAKRGMSTI